MANRKATIDNPDGGRGDEYEQDLERDNRQRSSSAADAAGGDAQHRGDGEGRDDRGFNAAEQQFAAGGGTYNHQSDRQGQAQSPRELTPNEPPRQKEGH